MKSVQELLRDRLVQRALILFAVGLQGAYLYNAIRWQQAPDRGWFAMVQLGPRVVAVARPLGYQAGLRDGDVILRLNGSSFETFEELWALLDYEIGRVNTYEIERGDQTLTVEIVNRPLGFRRVFMQSGIFWILGTLITCLGFLVFAMKPFHAPSWAFMVMAVLLGIMIPHFAPAHHVFEPSFLNNVVIFVVPLMPASLLTLAMLFPQRKPALLSRRRWLLLPYVLSLTLAVVSRYFGRWVGFLPAPLLTIIYFYVLGAVLIFLGSSAYDYYRTKLVSVRLQSLVIFTGVALSFLIPLLELVTNLLFHVSLFPNLIAVYAVCMFFFPLSIGYAIARHDLFEISSIVRRTYGYILSSAAVVAAYGIVLSVLNLTAFASVSESRLFSVSFLLVVAFTFEPLHRRSQGLVDRAFYRQHYDYRRTIREISEAMTSILDPTEIHATLLKTFVNEMLLENGVLLLPDFGAKHYRVELSVGEDGLARRTLKIGFEDALVETLRGKQNPLFRHDVDLNPRFAEHRAAMQATFSALGAEVVIAMNYQAKTVGIVALGQKKAGMMFTLEDLDLIQTTLNQAGIALGNAKLFDELGASVKEIQILESIKSNLAKFVPQTVQTLIEESPEAPLLDKHEEDVSVIFADITGYASLSSKLPLGELNALVERYFGAFLDEIMGWGGDVNETSGDGLMVIFRGPNAKDHARAAVAAAIGIQRRARELAAASGDPSRSITMHVGVNSGVAALGATKMQSGAGARWTFTASGPTTNIAARLSGMVEARGAVMISGATHARLEGAFEFEDLGPQRLKNVEDPVRAFRHRLG